MTDTINDLLARAKGYIKLNDNERVLPVEAIQRLAYPYCATCREEGLGDCKACDLAAIGVDIEMEKYTLLLSDGKGGFDE